AKEIKSQIAKEMNLIASCGVAHNKLLAKIASDYKKPNGLCVIKPHEAKDFMRNLPVSIIPGVGRVTQRKLEKHNILICQDIWKSPKVHLTKLLGRFGPVLYNYAQGIDTRPVQAKGKRQSLGSEVTLSQDLLDIGEIKITLYNEIDHLIRRLSEKGLKGKTITLKIKYHDFTTITRSTTLPFATDDKETIKEECHRLLKKTLVGQKKLRLIGVSISHFDQIMMDTLQLTFKF
ncbi:MAG TPA: DNA polymerase IV, partial [Spirochaetes bacterium]|nr:DNA polymerase IV [Spirochaetota bacterium]